MSLRIEEKKMIVAQVKKAAEQSLSLVLADARGVSVDKLTTLRTTAREAGVHVQMARNTLTRRALQETAYACIESVLVGPTLLGFSNEHPGAAARIFRAFAKESPHFTIKAASFNGTFIAADQIGRLADLPTREQALMNLLFVLKEAAAGRLVRAIDAIAKQKEMAA